MPSLMRNDEIGRENAELRHLVAALQHLSSLAVEGAGLESVAEFVAERVDTAVAVVDQELMLLAASGGAVSDAARIFGEQLSRPALPQVLGVVGPTRRALRVPGLAGVAPMIIAPVPIGDEVRAYLLTLDDGELDAGEDMRLLLTEHAATICGVILGRDRIVAAAATQARNDIVEGVLSGKARDPEEVRRWAVHLGYDEQHPHRVISLVVHGNCEDDRATTASASVARFFTTQTPEAITALRGREVVVLLPEPEGSAPRAAELTKLCVGRVNEIYPDAVVNAGIGGMCQLATDIARSYEDARRTVEILGRMGQPGRAVAIEELGIRRLLLQVADVGQLKEFVNEVFGALLVQTNGTTTEYLSTLACYFRVNNSLQRASAELHLHRNTVSYRVRRVEELTELDFRRYSDRLMAQVALEILDMVDVVGEKQ